MLRLGEYNKHMGRGPDRKGLRRLITTIRNKGTGVLCERCFAEDGTKTEMKDASKGEIKTSNPPKIVVECPKCGTSGSMYVRLVESVEDANGD